MDLVVYGDFNCPYSCLASARADALAERRLARVDWRAVEHDPAIPAPSEPVVGEVAAMLDREVEQVRGLLAPGEAFEIRRPPVHPNSAVAVAAFAAAPVEQTSELRRGLFAALWSEGRDTGDPTVVADLGGVPSDAGRDRAAAWRTEWLGFAHQVVPTLVLPDGAVVPGLEALAHLADLAS